MLSVYCKVENEAHPEFLEEKRYKDFAVNLISKFYFGLSVENYRLKSTNPKRPAVYLSEALETTDERIREEFFKEFYVYLSDSQEDSAFYRSSKSQDVFLEFLRSLKSTTEVLESCLKTGVEKLQAAKPWLRDDKRQNLLVQEILRLSNFTCPEGFVTIG